MKDLVIAYRIYPGVSKLPAAFTTDKLKLSELCLKSFRNALGSLDFKLIAILDGCPPEYESLFRSYFKESELQIVACQSIGNFNTFKLQIDLLLSQNESEIVYFAEDDYFYLPNTLPKMIQYIREHKDVHFISSYDHIDYYNLSIHAYPQEIRHFENQHWRTAATTCLTFMTRKNILRKTAHNFEGFATGNSDAALWTGLTKQNVFNLPLIINYLFSNRWLFAVFARAWRYGWRDILFSKKYKLWIPIPSFSTHMESSGIAGGQDWRAMIRKAEGEII